MRMIIWEQVKLGYYLVAIKTHWPSGLAFLTNVLLILPPAILTCPYFWFMYRSWIGECTLIVSVKEMDGNTSEINSRNISNSFVWSMVSKHAWTSTFTKYSFGLKNHVLPSYQDRHYDEDSYSLLSGNLGRRDLKSFSLGYTSSAPKTDAPRRWGRLFWGTVGRSLEYIGKAELPFHMLESGMQLVRFGWWIVQKNMHPAGSWR